MRLKISIAQVPLAVLILTLYIFSHHKVSAEGEICRQAGVSNNEPGRCVHIESCAPYVRILQQQGAKASFLANTECYRASYGPVVCCPTSAVSSSTLPPPILPTTSPRQFGPPGTTSSSYGPLSAPDCGFSDAQHNRVVGGIASELGAWPWLAVLGYRNTTLPKNTEWRCGGSLISRQHILTAGHCVYGRNNLYLARLGDHNLNDAVADGAHPIDVPIQRAVIHPGYSNVNYVNDIAVLRLRRPVNFTPAIHPICLPIPPEVRDRNYVRNFPFVAGWGSVRFGGPVSEILYEIQLPVVTNETCAGAYARFEEQVIDQRVICAGYTVGGKDSCQGDSGGPMMFPIKQYYYAIGVVSYSFKCAKAKQPTVYTRVTEFMDFITENMN